MTNYFKLAAMALAVIVGPLSSACSDDDDDVNVGLSDEFVVSPAKISIASSATSSKLTIKANAKPVVTSDASWLTVGEVVRNGGVSPIYTTLLTAEFNSGSTVRTATLSVTAGANSASVVVTQAPSDAVAITTTGPIVVDAAGGTVTVQYQATSAVAVAAPQWMTQTSLTADAVTFSVSGNSGDARQGEVVISLASAPSVSASILVTQAAMPQLSGLTAAQIAVRITAGVNIGNTLEATGGETAWGNPAINRQYIQGLKALGFNAVRIPCAWDSHVSDASTNTIDADWLARVDEVVGMVVDEDMYAIVNIHWDGGWLENHTPDAYSDAINAKQRDYWTQIANKLNHYDDHLLFAGMNEPNDNGGDGVANILAYAQTFINAVRATGGNNGSRTLVVQGPSTNIDQSVVASFCDHLPTDVVADRLMVEVHYYDPYQFTIMPSDESWGKVFYYWGAANHVDGSDRNSTWGEEDYVAAQFKKLSDKFSSHGIPVVLGEYGTSIRSGIDNLDKHKDSRAYWNEVVTREARNNGCLPFYWETGGDISRSNGQAINQYAIDGIMRGVSASTYPY